ncbi:Adenylyltransferase and sulfurtransferase UBA4 [Pestalotiopsis fici W106-1]|uniref:Adenylyltransferase and sulfurtransferase uba4 n=1 Tax=Pestalotiopsis fici (strain W106-1 / CGMCC3.15140) TaxID=1229662 RepID=W3XNI8_PESFW|nr:Adenylyltransferase and sulfurtransferase UBA4 [Pestalotiopsis fici W106-1]ETS86821.1 Adenylyltransferase and sulfurtransferase UBA4 [Pestalotiopsis fici W106-1]
MDVAAEAVALRQQIHGAEKELAALRARLVEIEALQTVSKTTGNPEIDNTPATWKWPLREEEYARYGRQLILPSVGIQGQLRLKSAAVLIIGAGGLGCPAAAYLAGAGVGTLGLVDGDTVEESNLHRQIAHSSAKVGMKKVDSLADFCRELNPEVTYTRHGIHLEPQNAEEIVSKYDIVLDCTDHPTSRYLVSDICVLLQKPLISASALRTDGQLIVLNNPAAVQGQPGGGPCYRCVFPKPPPAESVVSCGEGGILGPVVGIMGVLQALEAIKIIAAGVGMSQQEPNTPSLLLFSASGPTTFRSMKMRGRRPNCFACSPLSELSLDTLKSGSLDYVAFCGTSAPVRILAPEERISATAYNAITKENPRPAHVLLDVREREHFDIASIHGAINIPFSTFQKKTQSTEQSRPDWLPESLPPDAPIYVVCRVGNDSQLVTQRLKDVGLDGHGVRFIGDISGGMRAWKQEVDTSLPFT